MSGCSRAEGHILAGGGRRIRVPASAGYWKRVSARPAAHLAGKLRSCTHPNFIGLSRRQLEGPQVFTSDSGNIRPSWMNIKRVDNRVSFDRYPGRGRGYVGPGAGLPERLGAGSWIASSSGSGPATCRA